MFDPLPEYERRSTIQVVLGFLLGVVFSLGCLFLSIFLAYTLNLRGAWPYFALNTLAIIGAGIVALRHFRRSSDAAGAVIALSLALLLDAICGVSILR